MGTTYNREYTLRRFTLLSFGIFCFDTVFANGRIGMGRNSFEQKLRQPLYADAKHRIFPER